MYHAYVSSDSRSLSGFVYLYLIKIQYAEEQGVLPKLSMRSLLNACLRECMVASVISCWWLWYIFFPFAHAADIQASARISDGETQVGQPVRLDVIVQGARNVEVPNDIKIEGLRLSYIGRS